MFFDILNMEDDIRRFTQHLITNTNNQNVLITRFQNLTLTFSDKSSSSSKQQATKSTRKPLKAFDFKSRTPYLSVRHLESDLRIGKCDAYMEATKGQRSFKVFDYDYFIINPY